ncbi:hypothetical protein BJX76DRAFT_362126 [Aspergillus varians]
MTFISGTPLYDNWFGHRLHGTSPATTRAHRTRALESIASAMIQLKTFMFQTSGSLLFDSSANPSTTGPARRLDQKAMLNHWFTEEDPIYISCPPSNNPKAHYTLKKPRSRMVLQFSSVI